MQFKNLKVLQIKNLKSIRSSDYNYDFYSDSGLFLRWGKTEANEDDPLYAWSPEILDMEISTICHGIQKKSDSKPSPCKFCYKSNNGNGENMSFETFKVIFNKIPINLTQIAFGIGDIDGNPDIWRIMEYCRDNKHNIVIPNVTINGYNLTDEYADNFARLCGAIAVSHYDDDICFDAVKKLTDRGMTQVNIHKLVAEETFDSCIDLLKKRITDPRLSKMNAIVFLGLKQKGRGKCMHPLSFEKYKKIVDYAIENNIAIGFDSCSAYKFLKCVENHPQFERFKEVAEPCESFLFSSYCNVKGEFFPCSFIEGELNWEHGISAIDCEDFIKDIWFHPKFVAWRTKLLETANKNNLKCRVCPIFSV